MSLVPELYVSDFTRSLAFYTDVIGFRVRYDRPEERFAYLELAEAELMIEQTTTPGRSLVAAELAYPYGRGLNLSIDVPDLDAVHARVQSGGHPVFLPLEERWYRRGEHEVGQQQFVVMDPDGYLLRLVQPLGTRGRSGQAAPDQIGHPTGHG